MAHPLEHNLAILRRRARQTAMLYGVSTVAAIVLASAVPLGLADYLMRFQDRGLRAMATLLAASVLVGACYRYVYAVCKMRLRSVDLALRVERHFPTLKNKLVSAIEFLQQADDDPTAGSPVLRRAVVAEAAVASRGLDFVEVLDSRSAKRAALVLTAAGLLTTALVAFDPVAARTAVARLVNPFAQTAWPQENHLAVREPVTHIARGQAFAVAVIDAQDARLPADVRIHYRFEGPAQTAIEEAEPMSFVKGAMVARRENLLRPFSYRVEGGDDQSMAWRNVAVVDPPAVTSLAIRLIPPAYCGGREESSERHIRALVGTRVEMAGRAGTPIASATLCFGDGRRIAAQIGGDGCDFTIPAAGNAALLVERSDSYWFELADREGLVGIGDRWEIHAVPDAAPTVTIEQPAANLFVTPQAVLPLRVAAKDDLALRKISLVFRRSQPATEDSLPLYAGPDKPPPGSGSRDAGAAPPGDRRVVECRWELAPLGLQPGVPFTFWATASDYLSQVAKSEPRRLTVITPQALEERLAERQQLILAELQRALKMQQGCRAQMEALAARFAEVKGIEQADVDRFQALQLAQREVGQVLTGPGEGLPMLIHSLLTELQNNGVVGSEVQRCMEGLLADIERVNRQFLTPIGRELTTVGKSVQIQLQDHAGAAPLDAKMTESLAAIRKGQEQATAALEQMLAQLSQWDNYRRLHRDMEQLLHEQEEVGRDTAQVGRRTLSQEPKELATQDAAELKRVANRQFELARRLNHIFQAMERTGDSLRQRDRPAAEAVADALAAGRRLGVDSRMQAAAGHVELNQIGQAVAVQKQIALDLQDVSERLTGRERHPPESLGDTAQRLQRREQTILGETKRFHLLEQSQGRLSRADAVAVRDLARQQRLLQSDAARLGTQGAAAGVLQLVVAAASESMNQAATLLDRRELGVDTERAEQDALRQLTMLLDAFRPEDAAPQAETHAGDAAAGRGDQSEMPGKYGQSLAALKLLRLVQQNINLRTEQVRQAVGAVGKPAESRQRVCDLLGDEQQRLGEQTLQLQKPIEAEDEAGRLASTARQMQAAGSRIRQADVGDGTQGMQRGIVADLERILADVLKSARRSPSNASQSQQATSRTPADPSQAKADATSEARPGGQSSNKPAAESKPLAAESGPNRTADGGTMRGMMKQLWGQLPQHARQQMLQSPVEGMSPKYEQVIEEYFRRLAEEKPKE